MRRDAIRQQACQVQGCPRVRAFPSWWCEEHRDERRKAPESSYRIVEEYDVQMKLDAREAQRQKEDAAVGKLNELQRQWGQQFELAAMESKAPADGWQLTDGWVVGGAAPSPPQVSMRAPDGEVRAVDLGAVDWYASRGAVVLSGATGEAAPVASRAVQVVTDPQTGIAIRFVRQYDVQADKQPSQVDIARQYREGMLPARAFDPSEWYASPSEPPTLVSNAPAPKPAAPLNLDLKRAYFED